MQSCNISQKVYLCHRPMSVFVLQQSYTPVLSCDAHTGQAKRQAAGGRSKQQGSLKVHLLGLDNPPKVGVQHSTSALQGAVFPATAIDMGGQHLLPVLF